jgi:hypothetical protein
MKGSCYTIYCHHDGYTEHIIPLLRDCYNTQEKIESLIIRGDTSAIYAIPGKCRPYAEGENAEPYENNAPEVSAEFKITTGYLYEYYWDGKEWFFRDNKKPLKPISEYEIEE